MRVVLQFWKVRNVFFLGCPILTHLLLEYLSLHPDDTQPATMTQKSLLAQVQVSTSPFFPGRTVLFTWNPQFFESAQGNSDLKLPSIYYWFRRRRVKLEEQSRQPPPQSSNQGRLITTPLTPTSRSFFLSNRRETAS